MRPAFWLTLATVCSNLLGSCIESNPQPSPLVGDSNAHVDKGDSSELALDAVTDSSRNDLSAPADVAAEEEDVDTIFVDQTEVEDGGDINCGKIDVCDMDGATIDGDCIVD